jgi:hypothetical protein
MKQVYLIQSLEDGNYKIGISKNPQKRLYHLQTANSSQLKLIDTYSSEFAHIIETTLKNQFSHVRKVGEWFDFGVSDISTFIERCKQIEENIKLLKENDNLFI